MSFGGPSAPGGFTGPGGKNLWNPAPENRSAQASQQPDPFAAPAANRTQHPSYGSYPITSLTPAMTHAQYLQPLEASSGAPNPFASPVPKARREKYLAKVGKNDSEVRKNRKDLDWEGVHQFIGNHGYKPSSIEKEFGIKHNKIYEHFISHLKSKSKCELKIGIQRFKSETKVSI